MQDAVNFDQITGNVEAIIFASNESDYAVVAVREEKERASVKCCGPLRALRIGESITCYGEWKEHIRYGRQFSVKRYEAHLPQSVFGIERYLASGLIEGIGPVFAKKIVQHFGDKTFEILDHQLERLCEIEGIGEQRLASIRRAWTEQKTLREIVLALQNYDISSRVALEIFKKYGTESLSVIRFAPYRLVEEISGIGFKTADKIALASGWKENASERLQQGVCYFFEQLYERGHTCYPELRLRQEAATLMNVQQGEIDPVIAEMITKGCLVAFRNNEQVRFLQQDRYYHLERSIENALMRIQRFYSSLRPIRVEEAITWAQTQEGFAFATEQADALRNALKAKISILTGGPGTGKTTILRALTRILKSKKCRVELVAPTGRAAQKMKEATGLTAKTIHRLLQYNPVQKEFLHNEFEPIRADYLIVDETSMLDEALAFSLLRALPSTIHILFVGDSDQLPSVGAGNFLADLIASKCFRVTRLQQIFRQNDGSNIPSIAHSIISEQPILPPLIDYQKDNLSGDIAFIEADDAEKCASIIEDLVVNVLPKRLHINAFDDIQVLAPMYRGTVGIHELNRRLQQKLLHLPVAELGTLQNEEENIVTKFHVGDKVLQRRNNYEKGVFNGDLGRVLSFDKATEKLLVRFNEEVVEMTVEEQMDLSLAYAISIHKSQGSEFPIVIIPVVSQHAAMLRKNLLYTAITRGRGRVYLVGSQGAYLTAARTQKRDERFSHLIFS